MKYNYSFRRTLSVLVLLMASTLTWAWDFKIDGIYYNIASYTSVKVAFGSYSGDVIIPSEVTYRDKTYSVTGTDWYAFGGCSITSVEIPSSLTSIGRQAFERCTYLTSINIPDGVTDIEWGAFWDCSSLTSIDIPNSVTSIGKYTFRNCSSLTTVICRAKKVPKLERTAFYNVPQSEATLYVPASALKKYKAAYGWKNFGTILPIEGNEDIINGKKVMLR